MHPTTLLLIVVAAGACASMACGDGAANTPAAQFWEQVLPDTPMPQAIADLVQKGIDHSPLGEQHSGPSRNSLSACALFDAVCSSQMVAKTGVFFLMEQIRPGSTMTLFFPSEVDSPAILPHDVAEKAPFANLDDVLSTFNIPAGSAAAARVRDTLSRCQAPPLAGEVKACATSLEATVQAALRMLGGTDDDRRVVLAAASEIPLSGLPRQPYVIEKVSQVDGEQYVSCHRVPFPYAVYQCHTALMKAYGAYQVSLRGLAGASPAVEMLAFCHLDTSGWNPAHPAFEVLQTRPGDTPVCHFVTYGNLAFVKKKASWALA